jgi:hypothetical protein
MDSFVGSAVQNPPLLRESAANAIVPHRNWTAARDRALEAVRRGTKMTGILGPPGVGKTLLLEDLARTLEASGVDVWLLPPGEAAYGADEDGVVLIDEDCRLNGEAWARMFRSPGRYVIAGQPMLAEYLRTFPYGVETVFINPIDADEAAPFIMAQLLHFGEPTELFSRAAVSRLTERAGGIPQMLSTLARSALHLAHTEQADTVRPRHVDEAAIRDGELSATNLQQRASPVGPASTTAPRIGEQWWKWPAVGLVCVGAIVGIMAFFVHIDGGVKDDPAPAAATAATAPAPQVVRALSSPPADDAVRGPSSSSATPAAAALTNPVAERPSASPPEGQHAAASLASVNAAGVPQGNDMGQRSLKHHLPGTHSVKHHRKPASPTHPSDQADGG